MTFNSTGQGSSVEFRDAGEGVFWIQVQGQDGVNTLTKALVGELLHTLKTLSEAQSLKVLVLRGAPRCFARGGRDGVDTAIEQRLFQAIARFPAPVIAALEGDATGAGFLLASVCDLLVCSEEGHYGFTSAAEGLVPSAEEERLFNERFGEPQAARVLHGAGAVTGADLRAQGWTCTIAPAAEVEAFAQRLAMSLAGKSQRSLRLLKQHLAQPMLACTQALVKAQLPAVEPQAQGAAPAFTIAAAGEHVEVQVQPGKVLLVTLRATAQSAALAEVLSQVQEAVQSGASDCRAIVLASEHPGFVPGLEGASLARLQQALLGSALPVVAVLGPEASGAAWLLAQCCDGVVHLAEGRYSGAGLLQDAALASAAGASFTRRFGVQFAKEILLGGAEHRGAELQQRAGVAVAADAGDALAQALAQARAWAAWPAPALQVSRQRRARSLREEIAAADWPASPVAELPQQAQPPQPLALDSGVIRATAHPHGIVVVRMEDREQKNLFGEAFIRGMREVFGRIAQDSAAKVVILTGFDKYFASGGTREALLAIQQGQAKFTDDSTWRAAFDCPLPVIAALQGHAVGGGLSLGLFADFVLLSEESQYVSPYMNYGFTPGAGATLIVPHRLGQDLGRQTLLGAQEYAGSELRARGVPLIVLPRAEVEPAAFALALRLARHSREGLVALKRRFNCAIQPRLAQNTQQELAMHEQTFVGQAHTLQQIQGTYAAPAAQAVAAPQGGFNGETQAQVTATLKSLLAKELHLDEADVDENTPFIDLGLDSITGVTWIRKTNARYGLALEATTVYSHPTLNKLGRHVREELGKRAAAAQPQAPAPVFTPAAAPARVRQGVALAQEPRAPAAQHPAAQHPASRDLVSWRKGGRPALAADQASAAASGTQRSEAAVPPQAKRRGQAIAVIGMAGQFPGARTLDEYWSNIAQGRNCIREIPRKRWDVDAYYQPGEPAAGKTNCRWMGVLDDIESFDPMFFNILPAEARSMDPQQRLFLQACWQSIENAGYDASRLSGSLCGVFVGCAAGDYGFLSEQVQLSAHGFTGGASSILAARISYFLNLQGPCLAIDTACSSSLVAIASACDSLVAGGSDLALAGGVYVGVGPAMHLMTAQAGMLSPDGRCYSFDGRANGFVPGEGVGAVLLKRLEDAERDGDIIHGVIQGWGVNQDGRTNGITAPNPDSQARLQQQVYERHGIDPAGIQLVEAHGTGTVLGDPIEIEGLKKSFGKYTANRQYCAIGSVKSNIGHALLAAGISGFIKLMLALQHRQLPPTANFDRLNEHIRLEDSPFYVNTRLQDWTPAAGARRQAAVSSFGYSGTNAHVVVGEHVPGSEAPRSSAIQGGPALAPLSARTGQQLQQRCRDLLDFLRGEGRSADLRELAYTLQVGRQAMEERVVLLTGSLEELAGQLQAVVEGDQGVAGIFRGQVRPHREGVSIISQDEELKALIVDKWIAEGKADKLAGLWAKGVEIDWQKLHGASRPRRIVLPGYPFAKEHYWIDEADIDTERIVNAWRNPASEDLLARPEEWVAQPLDEGPGGWRDRVEARAGGDILVVSAEREHAAAIERLCRGVEEIVGHPGDLWQVAHAPIQLRDDGRTGPLDLAPLLRTGSGPLSLFLFLPARLAATAPAGELDIAFECVEALASGAAGRQVQLYCCYQDGGGEASLYHESLPALFRRAMAQRPEHRLRSIGAGAQPSEAQALPLRAMREWMCDLTRELGAVDVPMVRYIAGERFVSRSATAAQPAPAAESPEPLLRARIEAFEAGRLSKEEFVDCLSAVEVERLSESMQQHIVRAIERAERAPAGAGATPDRILASVEKVLGLKADAIAFDRPLQEYGMDSISSVRLTAALEKEFGLTIPPSALVAHPTVNALAEKVGRDLARKQRVA